MKGCALIFGKEAAPKLRSGSYADGMAVLESWERFGTGNPTFAEQNPHAEAFGTADGLFPYRIDHLFCSARALCGFPYRKRPSGCTGPVSNPVPCEKPAPFCTQRVRGVLRYRKQPSAGAFGTENTPFSVREVIPTACGTENGPLLYEWAGLGARRWSMAGRARGVWIMAVPVG